MADFKIITDSCCDLSSAMAQELSLDVFPMMFVNDSKEYQNFLDGRELSSKNFYKGLRGGAMATTVAINPTQWSEMARPHLNAGMDVLILAFSSGLSVTANNALLAAEELREEFPERKILVVDTLAASMGQGLLCYHVAQKRISGAGIEETCAYAEELKLQLCHWFTVDDLHFLKRGGRVSSATAVVGSLLQIKPVLHVDDEGHLTNVSKARGRRASLNALVEEMGKTATDPEEQVIFISHGDCLEDAEYVRDAVVERFGVKEVHINPIGPVIGAHAGPGTVALFFVGKKR